MSTTSHFVSSTAVPLLLTIPPLYFLYSLVFPSIAALPTAGSQLADSHHDSYNWAPTTGPKALLLRDYTPRELARYDGKGSDGRILLAIKGQVFDVSAGRNFYGPGTRPRVRSHSRRAAGQLAGPSVLRPATDARLPACACSDGAYGNFAGRDASRGMAKQSFDEGASRPRSIQRR
jgi:membrane-associated progesterone receptor component